MPSKLLLDLRHAFRGLGRSPMMVAAAILCIGLGIGATTSIYAAVHTALLRPLPFPEPDRLVTVFRTTPQFSSGPFAPGNFLDLERENRSLQALAAVTSGGAMLQEEDGTVRATYIAVAGDFATVAGVQPRIGRMMRPDDADADAADVAVLSEEFWREHYGADAAIVGRTITVNGEATEVVGVLPRGFSMPHGGQNLSGDLWLTLTFGEGSATVRRSNYLRLMGRLNPGWTVESADAELRAVMEGIIEENPILEGEQLRVVPLHEASVSAVRAPLLLLLGAVGFVLLIAAANVASMLMARGAARQREWAVRTAMGAGTGDVVRSAAVESFMITGAGAILGLFLAWVGVRAIAGLVPSGLPQLARLSIEPVVLATGLAVAVVVGLLAGVGPAWRAQRTDPHSALRAGDRAGSTHRHHRFLRTLIVVEVALSLVLLLGAGLVFRGFTSLLDRDPGFETDDILTLTAHLDPDRYRDLSANDGFLRPVVERLRAVPGIEGVGTIQLIPYTGWGWNFNIRYEGQEVDDPTRLPLVETRYVSPGFFDALGMSLLDGRLFDPADAAEDAPVVVVANEALARRDFPDGSPVGKRFAISDSTYATIVGVVADIRNMGPSRSPNPEVYWNVFQTGSRSSYPLMIRTAGADPARLAGAAADAIREIDPTVALTGIRSMDQVIASSVGRPRFYLALIGTFAAVALLLALAGLYGVMSYVVAQRTREIGIRAALGSAPVGTVVFVLRSGLGLVAVGTGLGLAAGIGVSSGLDSFLYGISPLDPLAWIGTTAILLLTATAALLIPAWRAARVDPVIAIRTE